MSESENTKRKPDPCIMLKAGLFGQILAAIPFTVLWATGNDFERGTGLAVTTAISAGIVLLALLIGVLVRTESE